MKMRWLLTVGAIFAGNLVWAQALGIGGGGALAKMQEKISPVQEYSVTMVMDVAGQTVNTKMFQLGKKVRTEVNHMGMQAITIVDPEADDGKGVVYTLMPMMKTYVKMPIPAEAASQTADDNLDFKIDELGKEDVDGVSCDKRRVTVTVDGKELSMTVWTSPKAKDMPVKMEMTEPMKSTILYKDYDFTKPAASLFTLPADYTAMDLGGMMPRQR